MTALRLAGSMFIVAALTAPAPACQTGPDELLEIVTKLGRQATSEVLEAEKADEDSDALEDLGRRWAAKLWEFHARPEEAKAGASEAQVRRLVHSGIDEVAFSIDGATAGSRSHPP